MCPGNLDLVKDWGVQDKFGEDGHEGPKQEHSHR
jgi:hypothetical protein